MDRLAGQGLLADPHRFVGGDTRVPDGGVQLCCASRAAALPAGMPVARPCRVAPPEVAISVQRCRTTADISGPAAGCLAAIAAVSAIASATRAAAAAAAVAAIAIGVDGQHHELDRVLAGLMW